MDKYRVVPPQDGRKTYDLPPENQTATYFVRAANGEVISLSIVVRKVLPDWAPVTDTIRVEGYTKTPQGSRGVIAYYRLHSSDPVLGELQVQDT